MKKLLIMAALVLAASSAQAQNSISFEINGRKIHVAVPKQCDDTYCLSVSTGPRSGGAALAPSDMATMMSGLIASVRRNQTTDEDADEPGAPAAEAPAPKVVAVEPRAVTPAPIAKPVSVAPAPVVSVPVAKQAVIEAPPVQAAAVETPVVSQPAAVEPAPVTSPPATAVKKTTVGEASPLGVWMTENREGRVHIVQCGKNLCGYVIDPASQQDGAKVLIDMASADSVKWVGRIHDPKGGGTYDSTLAMKSADTLRVQGCAFGGLMCRGQTWSRV